MLDSMKPGRIIYYQEPVFINPYLSSSFSEVPIPDAPDVKINFKDTPIDEAVQAVREAQDSVGKDIWEE